MGTKTSRSNHNQMREIKFRGYLDKKKAFPIMSFDRYTVVAANGEDRSTREGEYNRNRVTIVEYTGLKDKNGKEIYEGDVVDCKCGYCSGTVEIRWNYDISGWTSLPDEMKYCKVIGNIYENKELLK